MCECVEEKTCPTEKRGIMNFRTNSAVRASEPACSLPSLRSDETWTSLGIQDRASFLSDDNDRAFTRHAHHVCPACAMESHLIRSGLRRVIASSNAPSQRQTVVCQRRWLATPTESSGREPIRAARPIQFSQDKDQFSRGNSQGRFTMGGSRSGSPRTGSPRSGPPRGGPRDGPPRGGRPDAASNLLLQRIRIVPASPSYFTATPRYTDDLLVLSGLLRKHQLLPQLPPGQAPRVAWKTYEQYKAEVDEPVKETRYNRLLEIIKRLNYIHPALIPEEVTAALERFKRTLQPFLNKPKPIIVDEHGRARASGRRKSSTASVYVVEGTGEAIVNGKSLTEYFGRLHDRESAVWALKATQRLDKYNVWAVASGGGTTGQAESIMLAVAKALMAHEPDLKPALRLGKIDAFRENVMNASLTPFSQLALSHVTPSVSRGRSLANSRLVRCPPGLSVKYAIVSLCTEYVLHTHFQLVEPSFPNLHKRTAITGQHQIFQIEALPIETIAGFFWSVCRFASTPLLRFNRPP
jgi:small subunit ribosomal protein S9